LPAWCDRSSCGAIGERNQSIALEAPASTDTVYRIDIAFHKYGPKGTYYRGEKGAKLTIIENETEGPRLARYRPHPNAILAARLEKPSRAAVPF
jgi:hypothetical protein